MNEAKYLSVYDPSTLKSFIVAFDKINFFLLLVVNLLITFSLSIDTPNKISFKKILKKLTKLEIFSTLYFKNANPRFSPQVAT